MTIWGTWDIENKKNCDCQSFKCRHTPIIDKWSCQLSDNNFYQGNNRKELINFFLSLNQKKSKKYLLYAHNGNSYDIYFLISSFVKLMDKEEKEKFIQKKNGRAWHDFRWKNIRFLDSWQLLKKTLSEMMNDEEIEIKNLISFDDNNNERKINKELADKYNLKTDKEILNAYNKNDTIALFRILNELWKKYPFAKGKPTIASFSFYTWRKENQRQFKKLVNLAKPWADEVREFCERGYCASLEENYNESIWEKESFKYDMNSFYAFIMKTKKIPLGSPHFATQIFQSFNPKKEIGFFEVEFENLQLKENAGWVPFLSLTNENGIKINFSFSKTYLAVLATPLLELTLKAYSYTSFKILKKCLFRQWEEGFFKDFVEKYGNIKEEAKRKGEVNGLSYTMAKNFLNSLYGKFGQKVFRYQRKFTPEKKKLFNSPTYWDKNNNPWHFKESEEEKRSNGFNYVPISAFVTAYARVFIVETIKDKGKNNILYCAKDSLVSKIPFLPSEIDPVKTGKWKLEGIEKNWISHSVKGYHFGENVMKGLSRKEAQKLDFRELQTKSLKVMSKTSFKTQEGVIITKREKTFKPSIENQKKDLINGFWVPKKFNYDWDYWDKIKKIN